MKRYEVALLIGAALSVACGGEVAADKPSRPVRVEQVSRHVAPGGLRYSATIQPYEQVQLSFKASGYVSEVSRRAGPDGRPRNLQQGDLVSRGTVLARINPADYQEKVNQAKAQLAEAEASLTKARADGARAQALYEGKALTRPDFDAATAGLAGAAARADAARAALEAAQIALRDGTLVSPLDGVVLSRSVEVGTLAAPETPGFTLADLTRVKAVFGVPDQVVQSVQVGTPLMVTSTSPRRRCRRPLPRRCSSGPPPASRGTRARGWSRRAGTRPSTGSGGRRAWRRSRPTLRTSASRSPPPPTSPTSPSRTTSCA